MSQRVRKAIEVTGIVQGVGFRPYVYRLAVERRLAGFITNTAAGVSIEVEGTSEEVEDFVCRLPIEAPPLARITHLAARETAPRGEEEFRILPSRGGEDRRVLISPDVAICDDCRRELFDPSDRRFHYPFINCTNCGPRYTIVRDIPYDRARTSMAVFPMCADCRREYEDPLDRRFHAQPNACWKCGPQVELWNAAGAVVHKEDSRFRIQDSGNDATDPIAAAAARLRAGCVVAVKGLGGFHLAADATNRAAVRRLREGKRRVEKPFAIMVPSLEAAGEVAQLDAGARALLSSPERPIVLLRKRLPAPLADLVAPFNLEYGVFLPYTPLHYLLLEAGRFQALVMTSGNVSEEPIAIDNAEAVSRLRGIADFFLVHNRDILLRCDDSVARVGLPAGLSEGRVGSPKTAPQLVRRSRGYVPVPVFLERDLPPILAVGGELKNTVCLTKGRHAFLSQHIGDLENLESYAFFKATISSFKRILEVEPEFLAYDLHPDYFSTRWALEQEGMKQVGVQHHHAHIASCMAENHLDGQVMGIALDGTGYGTDGAVWGGEVLLATYADFERAAHLEYVPMPGGTAAILEPWRMAVSYLHQHFGASFLEMDIPFVRSLDHRQAALLTRMADRRLNSPLTSSCGRLFDAVSALAGIRQRVNYEAQAAIELEAAIVKDEGDAGYPFDLQPDARGWTIGTRPLFEAVLDDLKQNAPAGIVSRRFHVGLVEVLAHLARLIRAKTGLDNICLSGGSFQNAFLFEHLRRKLEGDGLNVFTHSEVPCGDGGLSLGQALIAAHVSPS